MAISGSRGWRAGRASRLSPRRCSATRSPAGRSSYLQTDLVTTVGQAAFVAGVEARQTRVDAARQRVEALRAETAFAEELTSGYLLTDWPELTTH